MGARVLKVALAAVLLLVAGLAVTWGSRRWGGDGPLAVTGTIEALQVDVSPKIAGRIVERTVREGERVRRGQLLVRLDPEELEADVRRAEAATRAAEARLRDLRAGARTQELDEARANLRNATATRVWTEREFKRAEELYGKGLVALADVDRAKQAYQVAGESETAARERLELLRAGPRADVVVAAEADVEQARASLAMARKRLGETRLASPVDGVVLHKHMEVGETVNPGVAILTLVDPADMWLRAYVSETDLGRVRIGQAAAVTVDAFPGRAFAGSVTEIASQAEFTPKNVQTKKERVNLVFRIKIAVQNQGGTLKPGLPADAELRPVTNGAGDFAVVTRGLTKRFGKVVAVDHLDLRVRRGELYGFLGPNGAGKSTTLRMLCGILEPSDGEGSVLGIDLRADPEKVKSAIGYMSQRFSLYDDLTVDENLTFYARVYMVPRGERAGRIARMTRLADLVGRERQLAGQLSGGYRQRLALACALVHTPALIFLDEPTAGVDPVSRRTFWALIRRLADEGTTILVTTHYMDEAELCDTLGFIYQGRLIAAGSPAQIKAEMFARPVVEIAADDPRAAAEALADWDLVEEVVRVGRRLRLIVTPGGPGAAGVREHLAARGIAVSLAAEVEPSVEDLFVSFVDRERKTRVREQLRALEAVGGVGPGEAGRGA